MVRTEDRRRVIKQVQNILDTFTTYNFVVEYTKFIDEKALVKMVVKTPSGVRFALKNKYERRDKRIAVNKISFSHGAFSISNLELFTRILVPYRSISNIVNYNECKEIMLEIEDLKCIDDGVEDERSNN